MNNEYLFKQQECGKSSSSYAMRMLDLPLNLNESKCK